MLCQGRTRHQVADLAPTNGVSSCAGPMLWQAQAERTVCLCQALIYQEDSVLGSKAGVGMSTKSGRGWRG